MTTLRTSQIATSILAALMVMNAACLIDLEDTGTSIDVPTTTASASATVSTGSASDSSSETGVFTSTLITTTEEPGSSSGDTTDGSSSGSSTTAAADTTGSTPTTNLVFITSQSYYSDFMGVSGANSLCQAHAKAAKLPGTYIAWIADSISSPSKVVDMTDPTPISFPNGAVAFPHGFVGIAASEEHAALDRDEAGEYVGDQWLTWTNVKPDGTLYSPAHCANWTYTSSNADNMQPKPPAIDTVGTAGWITEPEGADYLLNKNSAWMLFRQLPCDWRGRLICFQIQE